MKTKTTNRAISVHRTAPRYPNEADRRYFEQKFLDAVTSTISGAGIITIFLFLILM